MGKPDPFNLVCFLGVLSLIVCFSSCPHRTDVSNSLTYCDDNRCDTDVSLFDRVHRHWVLCFPPPLCHHANRSRWRRYRDFETCPSQRGRRTPNTDPKRVFATPIPLNQVEVTVHKSSEHYPPASMSQYGPHSAESQSQDQSFVLNIGNDLENLVENGVKTG